MRKSILHLALVAAFCVAGVAQSATIVDQVTIRDQAAALPRTTMVTPSVDGVYRISGYFDLSSGAVLGTRWCLSLYWADDGGQRGGSGYGIEAPGDSGPSFASIALVVKAQANRPLRYQTGPCPGATKASPYNLYLTVEQLQ